MVQQPHILLWQPHPHHEQQVERDEVVRGGPPQSPICFWWIAKRDVTPDALCTKNISSDTVLCVEFGVWCIELPREMLQQMHCVQWIEIVYTVWCILIQCTKLQRKRLHQMHFTGLNSMVHWIAKGVVCYTRSSWLHRAYWTELWSIAARYLEEQCIPKHELYLRKVLTESIAAWTMLYCWSTFEHCSKILGGAL